MLPVRLVEPLRNHLPKVRALHEVDLNEGYGETHVPYALGRKYPRAGREWCWQYIFPSKNRSADPDDGVIRRHHLDESVPQRAVKEAARGARIAKHVSCHTLIRNTDSIATKAIRLPRISPRCALTAYRPCIAARLRWLRRCSLTIGTAVGRGFSAPNN